MRAAVHAAEAEPAALLRAELERLRGTASVGPVLDLACGRGRNALALARTQLPVIALDRDPARLAALRDAALAERLQLHLLRADLEQGAHIPLADASCGAVVVFRYLHRALAPEIVRVLAPGGVLLYETFTRTQREIAQHPRNTAFLLDPGELPRLFSTLETLHAEEAVVAAPTAEAVARLVARKRG